MYRCDAQFSPWFATLPVRDIDRTARFYIDILGFYCPGYGYREGRKVQCYVERDRALMEFVQLRADLPLRPLREVAVASQDEEHVVTLKDVHFSVRHLTEYAEEIAARGATIVKMPDEPYMPTLVVEDINGYHICFTQVESTGAA